jgi:hypothetical protein
LADDHRIDGIGLEVAPLVGTPMRRRAILVLNRTT